MLLSTIVYIRIWSFFPSCCFIITIVPILIMSRNICLIYLSCYFSKPYCWNNLSGIGCCLGCCLGLFFLLTFFLFLLRFFCFFFLFFLFSFFSFAFTLSFFFTLTFAFFLTFACLFLIYRGFSLIVSFFPPFFPVVRAIRPIGSMNVAILINIIVDGIGPGSKGECQKGEEGKLSCQGTIL